jgi:glutamine cyclotransferase
MKNLLFCFICFFVSGVVQAEPIQLKIQVVSTLPHDKKAFTQGLVIVGEDLYESTGHYGTSSVRKIDLQDGKILERYQLPPNLFGEGIAYVNGQLIQLTWQEQTAVVYDINPLRPSSTLPYTGQGWGLCTDGPSLLMTDGSSDLMRRNSRSFGLESKKTIKLNGIPLQRLNDIVCVNNEIYANVWMTDRLFRIDKTSGEVTAVINASHLLTKEEKDSLHPEAVLNGITYREKTGTFFITGKYWPKIFEIRFVPFTGNSKDE